MKQYFLLFNALLLFCILSCSEKKTDTTTKNPASTNKTSTATDTKTSSPDIKEATSISYFISAKSGLNYRSTPKGKVLGKFLVNTKVDVIKHTKIFEEIKDGNDLIKGEWVGVEKDKDTVYVFNGFLSSTKVDIDIVENNSSLEDQTRRFINLSIYPLREYEKKNGGHTLFVSLSDSDPLSEHPDSLAISEKYLGRKNFNDYHKLDQKYRSRFFYRTGISETDKVFIYHYTLDTIFTTRVKDLPVMAFISLYDNGDQPISQYDYLIGFDLSAISSYVDSKDYYNSFIYVGKSNPFQTGNIQPIILEKTDSKSFPSVQPNTEYSKNLATYTSKEIYKFTANNLNYYFQLSISDHGSRAMHMVVQSNDNQIVLNEVLFEGESASFAPFTFVNKKNPDSPEQWTGSIFKNKPPVLFGFMYESFGCPGIYVTGSPSGYVSVLCDNRH